MKIIDSLDKSYIIPPCIMALGNFDGVHKGHQELIKKTVELAKEKGLVSMVFTFNDLPLNVINPDAHIKNILTTQEKLSEIEALGVDGCVCIDFDEEFRDIKPETFAGQILAGMMNCQAAVCGFNYSFGAGGKGSSEDLIAFGKKFGFETFVLDEYKINGQTVSSSLIRKCLDAGNVKDYQKFSGRKYTISGKVIEGQHFGTRMGYPTVNLCLDSGMAIPKNGVYITNTYVNNLKFKSVTNVGNKPTVGVFDKNAETHIFDFNEDIYGKDVVIEFEDFLREEQKFDSLEELEKQIAKDCENALHFNGFVI